MYGNINDGNTEAYNDGHCSRSMEKFMTICIMASTSGLKKPKQILLKIWNTTVYTCFC